MLCNWLHNAAGSDFSHPIDINNNNNERETSVTKSGEIVTAKLEELWLKFSVLSIFCTQRVCLQKIRFSWNKIHSVVSHNCSNTFL